MVRTLLELLGIVDPDPTRREPVALPAWARHVRPILVLGLAVVSTLTYDLVVALVR